MMRYLPTGCGRHNIRKMAVLLLLSYRKRDQRSSWLSAGDIAKILEMTPAERSSLYVLLTRWYIWKLVERRHKGTYRNWKRSEYPTGRYEYRIARRGVQWLTLSLKSSFGLGYHHGACLW